MSIVRFLRSLFDGLKGEPVKSSPIIPSISSHLPQAEKKEKKTPPEKYFTLGIDFGTHGTKIAYRDANLGFENTKLITLDGSGLNGREESVFPSLVSYNQNRIYFGRSEDGAI